MSLTSIEVEMTVSALIDAAVQQPRRDVVTVNHFWTTFLAYLDQPEVDSRVAEMILETVPAPSGTISWRQWLLELTKGPSYTIYFPSEEIKTSFFDNWIRFWQDKRREHTTLPSLPEDSHLSTSTLPKRKRGITSISSMTADGLVQDVDASSSAGSLLESDAVGTYTPEKRSRGNDFTLSSIISTRNKLGRSVYKWEHNITSSEYVKIQIFKRHAIACAEKKDWWKSCVKQIEMPLNIDLPSTSMDQAVRRVLQAASATLADVKERPTSETQLEHKEDRILFPGM